MYREEKGDYMNILVVGGSFDKDGGNQSGLIKKIETILETKSNHAEDMLYRIYNGGHANDLEQILNETKYYDIVFWLPNVPNDMPKIRQVKEVNPYTLLVSSKRNDNGKYTFQELVNRSLGMKANLTIEFSKQDTGLFHMMVFDPLGTVWYDGTDLESCMMATIHRLEFLKSITRQKTIQTDDDPNLILNWYFNPYKQDEFKSEEMPEVHCQEEFLNLIKKYAEVFHQIMLPEKGVTRFLGNASFRPDMKHKETNFRCTKGFPSFRSDKYIFVSQRNVNKEYISLENFVATYLENNQVFYCGDKKPSVDTPIQLRLYEQLPHMNYMLHSHCYLKDAPFTTTPIPCGALEEVDEIMQVINERDPSRKNNIYKINLIGHGSIVISEEIGLLDGLEYIGRNLPEKL